MTTASTPQPRIHMPHAVPSASPQEVAAYVERDFKSIIYKWCDPSSGDPEKGERSVREALRVVESALTKLGTRTGARVDAARSWIESHRVRLTRAIEAYESVGAELDGPSFVELIDKVHDAIARRNATERVYQNAGVGEMRAARDEFDAARGAVNDLAREKRALLTSCTLPALPALDAFGTADDQTRDLASSGAPMTVLHQALDQGAKAGADVARLWIVYENNPSKLYDARWQRFAEAHPESVPMAVVAE